MSAAKLEMMNCIAAELGEDNDCAVKAVALVMGEPYTKVRDLLGKEGRKTGQPTMDGVFLKVVSILKGTFTLQWSEGETVNKFMRTVGSGKYLVTTKDHVFAVINQNRLDFHGSAKSKIESVFEIS